MLEGGLVGSVPRAGYSKTNCDDVQQCYKSSPRSSADLLGDTIYFEGMKVRMPHCPFRRFKTLRSLFQTCLSRDEYCFSALFAFLLLGTCSQSHGVGPKFTEVNRKTCSDNSFFEQAICY